MSYIFNGTHSNYYKKKGLLKFMEFFFSFNEKSFLTKNRNSNNNNNNFVFVLLVLLLLFQVVWNSRTLKPVNKRYWKGKEKKKTMYSFPFPLWSDLLRLLSDPWWSATRIVRASSGINSIFIPLFFFFFPRPFVVVVFFVFFRGVCSNNLFFL